MPIPPLAGLCTYEEAARVGVSVDDSVRFLLRLAWIRKRAMEMGLYWLNSTPQWEVKEALSLHLHLDAEHVGMLRRRISEMRNPPPPMDEPPSEPLEAFLKELLWAEQTPERIIGVYGVLRPAILEACWAHDRSLNPLVAHPTRRMLRIMIDDQYPRRMFRQNESFDNGVTWSPSVPTLVESGACPRLLKLHDGRLLLTYGRRLEPYGIYASLSEDDGKTWGDTNWLLRQTPDGDQGYTSSLELDAGRIFTTSYAKNADGVTGIIGTFWDLP